MVEVDMDDLHTAWIVWLWHYPGGEDRKAEAKRAFARFLDNAPLPLRFGLHGTWELTPEQERKMRLLLGPHWYTVMKAVVARIDHAVGE